MQSTISGAGMQGSRRLTPPQAKVLSRGFTQESIAERAGLVPMTVSRALRGQSFAAETQRRIAEVVGLSPRVLFGDWCHPSLRGAA